MFVNAFHLLNLVYPGSSCYRDKVSRAAGRRSVGSVFCSPFIKCTVYEVNHSRNRLFCWSGNRCSDLPDFPRISGLCHLDNSILTGKFLKNYQDFTFTQTTLRTCFVG